MLRQFAVASFMGSALIGFSIWRSTGSTRSFAIASAIGGVTCLVGMVAPAALRPLYIALVAITLPIGWLVSHALLMALYFVVITPIGWIFRLMGRDHLALERSGDATYWRPYRSAKSVDSYFRQA
jgi:hypothetical protein